MSKTDAFRNRLTKNARHWDKWAQRQGLECYRMYDRDLAEYPLIIDRYGEHVHLQEYVTNWKGSEAEYRQWRDSAFDVVGDVLDLPGEHIHFKQRRRRRGCEQYEKTGLRGEDFVVHENGLRFWVNLDAYLDTGLFLDHRITRRMIRERSEGKRFLNLFAYTGSFSVYAAAGGARSTLSVDLSNTYQAWTRRNLVLNDCDPAIHSCQREDVFVFLQRAVKTGSAFDLIVMDPPTFSSSKKMQNVLDIQRDHVALIRGCMELLSDDGELFFSNNLQDFQLDRDSLSDLRIRDITRQTTPEDFRRHPLHQCWIISRG